MFTYSSYFDGTREWDMHNIRPVDAKIYYENKPLEYKIISQDNSQIKIELNF